MFAFASCLSPLVVFSLYLSLVSLTAASPIALSERTNKQSKAEKATQDCDDKPTPAPMVAPEPAPVAPPPPPPQWQCNSGSLQCCNQVQQVRRRLFYFSSNQFG
jgi:hypothetical protein